ncbi:MAG: radical SAM protein [Candidatus Methanomethylicia archaeon]
MNVKNIEKVIIVDGYNDEPAGLGVPPYLDVYARYAAGAIWIYDDKIRVYYYTIDEVRKDFIKYLQLMNKADMLIVLGGVSVPGKYLGGTPITKDEVLKIGFLVSKPIKILGGPLARYGFCGEGGKRAREISEVNDLYHLVVKGDIEVVLTSLFTENLDIDKVDSNLTRSDYELVREVSIRGARIVKEHPNYGWNLICEIETYRGCPRFIVGGCSFCVEPLWGLPIFRPIEHIVEEVSTLYNLGVRHFRIGRQPDIYSYLAEGVGEREFPRPNPEAIKKLFKGIRDAAPYIDTLHIDNVNPGTIANYPDECREITKIIVQYHTPGDVAAMGIESADPNVIKLNNLKVDPEGAFKAIKIINEIGAKRGWNGLPELLPGINFVYGLIGEREETYRLNFEFMKRIMDEGLLVRRINIRQCIPLPGTKMWNIGEKIIRKHKHYFKFYKEKIRREIDRPMLKKILPPYSILKNVFIEENYKNLAYGRQAGSYPLLVVIPFNHHPRKSIDVMIIGYGYRSVLGIPLPIEINKWTRKQLNKIPCFKGKKVSQLINHRPISSVENLKKIIGEFNQLNVLEKHIDFSI